MRRANLAFTLAIVICAASVGRGQHSKPVPRDSGPPPKTLTFDLGEGVKLELVSIPAGALTMTDYWELGGFMTEGYWEKSAKKKKVSIARPFYLGKCEVTQRQWERVMGSNPSHFKGPDNPVDSVTFDECQAFLAKLNERLALQAAKIRFPSDAEWEHACRAGTTTRFSFGTDPKQADEYAWTSENAQGTTHPVGQKKPNAWGLYDMAGNVTEWCVSDDKSLLDRGGTKEDKSRAEAMFRRDGKWHVRRGSTWLLPGEACVPYWQFIHGVSGYDDCAMALRFGWTGGFRYRTFEGIGADNGLRVAKDVSP